MVQSNVFVQLGVVGVKVASVGDRVVDVGFEVGISVTKTVGNNVVDLTGRRHAVLD